MCIAFVQNLDVYMFHNQTKHETIFVKKFIRGLAHEKKLAVKKVIILTEQEMLCRTCLLGQECIH